MKRVLLMTLLLTGCGSATDAEMKAVAAEYKAYPKPMCFGTVVQVTPQKLQVECSNGKVITVSAYKYNMTVKEQ